MHDTLCPYCGHNFTADAPVEESRWRLDPRAGKVYYQRDVIVQRASWARILHTIAAAAPNIITADALLNRVSSSEKRNTIASQLSQMKRRWPRHVPWPVESVHGHGYRWAA